LRCDYGQTQLGTPSLQKGKLLDQDLALSLDIFPPPVDINHFIRQALEFCLGHFPGLARVHKLALKKGDLPSHLILFSTNEVALSNASCCTLSWASLIEVLTLSLTVVASCTKVVIACTTLCLGHLLLKLGHIICVLSQTLRESKGREC
jgi:hypothetical protein